MKCKIKTMKNCLHHGSFGHSNHNAVQRLFVIIPLFLQMQICTAFQYVHEEHHGLATTGYFHEELSLDWDDLQLQHLSRINGPYLHSNNGFHVIKATFPARQTSYILHLSKTQDLFYPEHLGLSNEEASNLDCLYSGTAVEVTSGAHPESGVVSLSTCHHKFGFEGLILLPNEQYYIRPNLEHFQMRHRFSKLIKRSATAANSSTDKPIVQHKAHKVNSKNGPYNKEHQSVDDVLRVPPEEYLKASQNQTGSQDLLEDESSPEETHDGNSILESTLMDDDGSSDSMPPVMVALSPGTGRKQKRKKGKKKPPKKASSTSSSGKGQVVEIAVFTDEKLYKTWQSRYPKDTIAKMNQYVLAVINNMNALYKQPSFTDSLSFRLVHLDIETSRPKILKDYNGHATKYLKSFCSYAAEKNLNGRLWDHALLLTGHDLNEGGSSATAGIAWFSTMCINSLSCSLIEGSTFGSTFITAHEIGHSLGMEHDGTGPNKACDPESYIMSPTTGGGKTDWSKCSMKNMKNFISSGYMGNPAPTCITKKGNKAGSPIKFSNTKLPGQQFPPTEQCQAECPKCTPYTTSSKPYNDMCHILHCAETKGLYSLVRSTHPALEGSTCAKGKTCRLGKCQ